MAYQDDYLNKLSPEELAKQLGQWRPSYNSNEAGSAERNYEAQLNRLTPELLLGRYANPSGVTYGSNLDLLNKSAYDSFLSMVGRAPTTNEFAQIMPYFRGPGGADTGRSAVAQFAEQYKNSPEALGKRAPEQYGKVGDIFNDLLKRGASQDELDYFGRALSTGEITPYEVRQFVQQMPEYRTEQDKQFRGGLASELQGYDMDFFDKGKESVISRFAQNTGGAARSSALDFALTDLMGNIAKERGSYLANLSAQQYGGNKDAAREDYRGSMNRYMGELDYNRQRGDSYTDALRDRSWNARDYEIQRDDFARMMGQGKRQGSQWGSIAGPLVGAGIGSFFGPPGSMAGAQLGMSLGGAAGRGYDYLNY